MGIARASGCRSWLRRIPHVCLEADKPAVALAKAGTEHTMTLSGGLHLIVILSRESRPNHSSFNNSTVTLDHLAV